MSKLDRHTVLVDDEVAALLKSTKTRQASNKEMSDKSRSEDTKKRSREDDSDGLRTMIPVKRADADAVAPVLIPVLPGSPWKYYVKGLFVKHWCLIAIAIRKRSGKDDRIDRDMYMIRSPPSLKAEKLQIIRQIRHLNVVDNIEIFSEDDGNCYIVSQMMETSLLHIRRAPDYPSESQLSCILFQVLSGAEYLMREGLVPESITCAGTFINLAGEVKIGNIEEFKPGGDRKIFLHSFCRLSMMLMDKKKGPEAKIGLSNLDRWSAEAVDLLSLLNSGPSKEEVAGHEFWKKGKMDDLKLLVYLTLISAFHDRS